MNRSILVRMIAPFQKIGIVFNPLGINHFIHKPLSEILFEEISPEIIYFNDSMTGVCVGVFEKKDFDKKARLLEEYFETILVQFKEPIVLKAVQLILDAEDTIQVDQLSDEVGVSRKTLLRLFNKHLNCSVKTYIDIVRFRKALDTYQQSNEKPLLTTLAQDVGYYDQSDFIKNFRKISGLSPKLLFKNIQKIGSENTFWSFPTQK